VNNVEKIFGRVVSVKGGLECAETIARKMIDDRKKINDYRWKVVIEKNKRGPGFTLIEKRNLKEVYGIGKS
jgi:hypothetical protein